MVPEGWRKLSYDDVCKINRENIPPSASHNREITYLDIGSIPDTGRVSELERLRLGDAPSRARRIVRDGDVVVSTVRPYLRAFAQISDPPENLVASTGFAVLTPTSMVTSDFLFQTVCSHAFVAQLEAKMVGSNYPAVNIGDVAETNLLLPPLPEQRKIAAILSSVDDAILATRKVIQQTRKVKKGLLQTLMTRGIGHTRFKKTEIGEIPEEWEVVRLDDLGEVITGSTPSTKDPTLWDGDIPFITPGDLEPINAVVASGRRGVTEEGASAGRIVNAGAVLMTCIASVGKAGIAGTKVAFNQQINAIQPRPTVSPRYLLAALRYHTPRLMSLAGTQTVPIINKSKYSSFRIPLPPELEQRAIAELLTAGDEQADALISEEGALATLKRGLMQDLLSGRVRVQPD